MTFPMPKSIRRTSPDQLTINWLDGSESVYATDQLRNACPCATCLQERAENAQQGLFSLPIANQTEIRAIELSGRNAMVITWGDGHKAGIYTWEYLKGLESGQDR